MVFKSVFRPSLFGLCLATMFPASGPAFGQARAEPAARAADPVKLTFVFMGCNRIQHKDWKKIKADDPSSANLPQLRQTSKDVARLDPVPPYLFFAGDLVVNLEDDDGGALKKQLDAWTSLYRTLPLAVKTALVPLPGNHEMLKKVAADKDDEDKVEVPNPDTDARG